VDCNRSLTSLVRRGAARSQLSIIAAELYIGPNSKVIELVTLIKMVLERALGEPGARRFGDCKLAPRLKCAGSCLRQHHTKENFQRIAIESYRGPNSKVGELTTLILMVLERALGDPGAQRYGSYKLTTRLVRAPVGARNPSPVANQIASLKLRQPDLM